MSGNSRKPSPLLRSMTRSQQNRGMFTTTGDFAMKPAIYSLLTSLLLSGTAGAADAPVKPHPFAPSLRDLTAKEEEAFDKIIDDFILYDVGALKGPEGKKALEAFQK